MWLHSEMPFSSILKCHFQAFSIAMLVLVAFLFMAAASCPFLH
jgi:hypothetical protein